MAHIMYKLPIIQSQRLLWLLIPHQQQVIEEEDLSLQLGQFLFMRLVGVRYLKQTTAAHQTPVRHGEDLQRQS